jgi:hypothetical protein
MPFELLHYKPRKISEIDFEKDQRVAIIGRIKEIRENSVIFQDASSEIEIGFVDGIRENKLIRIFCTIVDKKLLLVDFFQVLERFDLDLWEETNKLYKEANIK